ncbi:hypothetical protein NIES2101_10300 [Calothrix sp. HK-06]|nr:hypothetical protein NIES2101_10300 [Calothrix sp. HK-06]
MHQTTKDNPNPHRQPDDTEKVFSSGEFREFIQSIFELKGSNYNTEQKRNLAQVAAKIQQILTQLEKTTQLQPVRRK